MKAQEARKMAAAAQTGKLTEIYQAIEKAAKQSEYRTHVYFLIHPKDKKTLEEQGYKIDDVGERETCICISWGPAPYEKAASELSETLNKVDQYFEDENKKKPWWQRIF